MKGELLRRGRGGTQVNLNAGIVKNLELPLPPLPEQRRIAALLAEQLAAVERARAASAAQVAAAQALVPSYLDAAFAHAAKRWPVVPLGTVGQIGAGITLGRKLREVGTRRVPYLRVANVKDGRLDLSDVYETEATPVEIERCRLHVGDLLLTEGGDPDKLGRGTFWEEQIPECIHQNHIFRVRFDLDQFSPPFLAAQFGSSYGKAYFLAHAKRTTGIATINQKVLAGFPLVAPPLSEQQAVAATIKAQRLAAQEAQQAAASQLAMVSHLPAVLLRSAFAGEIDA